MSRRASLIASIIFFVLSFITMIFVLKSNGELLSYKNALIKTRVEYVKTKMEYDTLKASAKNMRQTTIVASSTSTNTNAIATIMNKYASQIDGDISMYYKNLATGETVTIDADKQYYMASLYKVILTLYILDQVKSGKVSLSSTIDGITLENALNKIITESNNEYAQSLAEKYGWFNIEAAMKKKLGIDFTFDEDLKTNVKNIGALFEDIALSLKITDTQSQYLLTLLNEQTKTSKLPKYLPKNIYSHNKTGEFENYSHDAGIFYTPKANYILVFMSKTQFPGNTDEQMALMSKEIYTKLNGEFTADTSFNSALGVSTKSAEAK
jgi:beta-lactamase class A